MLKIDERSYDQQRNKNPVRDRHLPWKHSPDREKKKPGDELHGEIAEPNFSSAICASAAKHDPADQRNILMPRN